MEVIDLYNPTCYWLARIVEVFAGRLSLQYEGYEDKQAEFWCYYLDERLRPVGNGLKNALTLYPPKSKKGTDLHFHFHHSGLKLRPVLNLRTRKLQIQEKKLASSAMSNSL